MNTDTGAVELPLSAADSEPASGERKLSRPFLQATCRPYKSVSFTLSTVNIVIIAKVTALVSAVLPY